MRWLIRGVTNVKETVGLSAEGQYAGRGYSMTRHIIRLVLMQQEHVVCCRVT